MTTTSPVSVIITLVASLIGAYGAVLLKKSADHISFRKLKFNMDLIIAAMLYGFSTILFVYALRGGELSVLYPIIATTYAWIALFSIKFLGEKMNRLKWMGVAFILSGVALIGIAHT
jgi:uncharacterized membrane protein